MKIYTKTGDAGTTSLIGGTRVPKFHIRIEAYGTVDELISFVGLLRDQEIDQFHKKNLIRIQDRLMTCAAILATDCENCDVKIPQLHESDILFLEKAIDEMEKSLKALTSFILPGGHPAVSYCHVARSVCRRAERKTLYLSQEYAVDSMVIKYLNRLSDYFFVLSRKISSELQADEIPWKPDL
jgi:cob(I)alamin adenosyltransferase